VTGAVTHPYEFQAIERFTLTQVLATAGGPAPNSNGQIELIQRDQITGSETKTVISIKALLEEDGPTYNIALKGGEEVRLPAVTQSPNDKLM
jgi:protein involved in polysaccharide export with SLBB domain